MIVVIRTVSIIAAVKITVRLVVIIIVVVIVVIIVQIGVPFWGHCSKVYSISGSIFSLSGKASTYIGVI